MTELERLRFWISLLELEVEALRSVLSECGVDLSEYGVDLGRFTQYQKAQAIHELKNSLVRP